MWLLDTSTYQLTFVQNSYGTRYAILSHVWDPAGEQTFQVSIICSDIIRLFAESHSVHGQDVRAMHASARSTFPNPFEDTDPRLLVIIRAQLSVFSSCCDYARVYGYLHLWIDACCGALRSSHRSWMNPANANTDCKTNCGATCIYSTYT